MIKDVPNSRYTQYMLDINLERDLRDLQQKRLSPRAKAIEKDRLLNDYCHKSILNREGEKNKNT